MVGSDLHRYTLLWRYCFAAVQYHTYGYRGLAVSHLTLTQLLPLTPRPDACKKCLKRAESSPARNRTISKPIMCAQGRCLLYNIPERHIVTVRYNRCSSDM